MSRNSHLSNFENKGFEAITFSNEKISQRARVLIEMRNQMNAYNGKNRFICFQLFKNFVVFNQVLTSFRNPIYKSYAYAFNSRTQLVGNTSGQGIYVVLESI